MTMDEFGRLAFSHCSLLVQHKDRYDEFSMIFNDYLAQVPSFGCIMLSEDLAKCVLVKSYNKDNWCFPRGKINENEAEEACAAREVEEEVGYDCSALVKTSEFIEVQPQGKRREKLYIVRGVPEDTVFVTKTRKEIGEIKWCVNKNSPQIKVSMAAFSQGQEMISSHSMSFNVILWAVCGYPFNGRPEWSL